MDDALSQKFFKDLPAFEDKSALPGVIKTYSAAIQKDPGNVENYYLLGRALEASGNKLDAIKAFERAISINQKHFKSLFGLGNIYFSIGEYKFAVQYYSKCLTYCPNFLECLYNCALTHERMAQKSQAIYYWKLYMSKEKDQLWQKDAKFHLKKLGADTD